MDSRNVIASSQPLAVAAGIAAFEQGGNAVDAALACAITLTVTEPDACTVGSDAFAIVHDGHTLRGFNGSGCAPQSVTLSHFSGQERVPLRGWDSVTVPGAISLWALLSNIYGCLAFEKLFDKAIEYAEEGFSVTPEVQSIWERFSEDIRAFPECARMYLPNHRPPYVGERFFSPDLVQTLNIIAQTKGESFYRGEIAQKISAAAKSDHATLTLQDLNAQYAFEDALLTMQYRDIEVHEMPPNNAGITVLLMLGILQHFDMRLPCR